MRLLILGVNGFIGRATAARAAASGIEVLGLARSAAPERALPGTYLSGERRDVDALRHLVDKHAVQAVVDVLPMTLGDTAPLLEALEDHVQQYVMLSSCDVYANYELLHGATGQATALLTEEAPLRAGRYPYRREPRRDEAAADRYLDDYDKIPIEEAVQALGCAWTILRLPMVYGPGDRQHRFRWAIGHMAASEADLLLPTAWANWTTSYGYIDNVAEAIALCVGHPRAAGQTFNVGEPAPASQLHWARRIADVMRWPGAIEVSDTAGGELAQSIRGLNLDVPLRVESGYIRSQLGFEEVVTVSDALSATVAAETR